MDKIKFGNKLKELREAAGDSQELLGNELFVGSKQIQRYEKGVVLPDHEKMEVICKRYRYDFLSLIYDIPREEQKQDFQAKYYDQLERANKGLQKDLDISLNGIHQNILLNRAVAETTQDLLIQLLAKQRKVTVEALSLEVGKANGVRLQQMKSDSKFDGADR